MALATRTDVGISAMSCYVPRLRVGLRQWCEWTGQDWSKVRVVTGRGFRMCGPHEDVYTMAANAVLKLITANGVDARRIGLLALGTESSTDNAVGAVTVLGMVDRELRRRGIPGFTRNVEVPEFKHACLGGMYALCGAGRYVRGADAGRQAIVVAADIAEYERGSTGEQTQGAGAVAMLVERSPALLALDLDRATSASAYRGPDFRKPTARHGMAGYAPATRRPSDFPVFSGRYSTAAYLDGITHAVETLWRHSGMSPVEHLRSLRALFFHRPYRRLPVQAASFLCLRALAGSPSAHPELEHLCRAGDVELDDVLRELDSEPDLYAAVLAGDRSPEPYPATSALSTRLRGDGHFTGFVEEKLSLGTDLLDEVGNLYAAALPAWLAAGLESAARGGADLAEAPMLAVGYGSGDAALALPCRPVAGWEEAARAIGFAEALRCPVDLDRDQYQSLHDRREVPRLQLHPFDQFAIERTGSEYGRDFQDLAVDFYAYEY
ncbi:hypothetical protein [Streptomyces niveiscabiei]|uniref:Hydroxymethylglutaryl-coenzyme A synthase N-terminal domain-containing protein n=1 Tax=Streptomyces niveiscabiei TaxID=164115 RepID=A0ABW9I9N1_9ACTN